MRKLISILGLVLIIALVGVFVFLRPQQASASNSEATLVVLTGNVLVQRSETDWVSGLLGRDEVQVPAGSAVTVHVGDNIYLGPAAVANLSLTDGSSVELSEGADLQILELDTSEDTFRVRLALLAGKTVNRVMRLIGAGDIYEIITPSPTISVRGTVFVAQVIDYSTTYVSCYEGVVHVVLGDDEVDVPAGYAVTATHGEALQVVSHGEQAPPPLTVPTLEQAPGDMPVVVPEIDVPADAPAPSNNDEDGGAELPAPPDPVLPGKEQPASDSSEPAPEAEPDQGEDQDQDQDEGEDKDKKDNPNPPDQVPGNPDPDGQPGGGGVPPGQGGEPPGKNKVPTK